MGELEQFIENFLQEAEELLSTIEMSVLVIEKNPNDRDALNSLFRAIHTIKGSGAMLGFDKMAAFTHHIETLLDKVRNNQIAVTNEIIDIVLKARDQISLFLQPNAADAGNYDAIREEIIKRANQICEGKSPEPAAAKAKKSVKTKAKKQDNGLKSYKIEFRPSSNLFCTGTEPSYLLEDLYTLAQETPEGLDHFNIRLFHDNLPLFEDMDPESCYLSWVIHLATNKDTSAIQDVFMFLDEDNLIKIEEVVDDKQDDLQSSDQNDETQSTQEDKAVIDKAEVAQTASVEQKKVSATTDTLRVASQKLDQLINIVGELVINQDQISQLVFSGANSAISAPVEVMNRLVAELRDIVLDIRMVPIGNTFSRYNRLVRDLCLEMGKDINLEIHGGETELDKTIIDRLGDLLVHLIRNSIDHGIESPEERIKANKPAQGTIRLKAEHQGASVIISIEDDGRGLDIDKITAKAIAQGLINENETLSEQDAYQLIFSPGFSTAAKITNVSGRGVGMDVVKRGIEALRGTIQIHSKKGQGSGFDLSLPLTLAIIDGLLVVSNESRYVIPMSLVEECIELSEADRKHCYRGSVMKIREAPVPLIRIREMFNIHGSLPSLEEIVVVGLGDKRVGIIVDNVVGNCQTVIKPLSRLYQNVQGISGATIMGDGEVALILDVDKIIRIAQANELAVAA